MSLPKILLISSVDPTVGPGEVALNFYNGFVNNGFQIDFLTKYPVIGHSEFISVYEKKPGKFKKKIKDLINKTNRISVKDGYYFFYKREDTPPVPIKKILKKIRKKYDVVYVVFWQEMLSFKTIEEIYKKLNCQIHFRCVDYSVMSGGCHFTGDCPKYMSGCGECPAIFSDERNDFTKYNVEFRKRIYNVVQPIVYGNNYMQNYYNKSFLLKDYPRKESVFPLVDNDKFYPFDKGLIGRIRARYEFSEDDFIIFIGSQSLTDERKGIRYLLKSLKLLYDKLDAPKRSKVKLLIAGKDIEPIKDSLCFGYTYLGYVKPSQLTEIYNISNIYVCPSVDDAGPTMVNQSLSCGTPVIAFEMGTAIDMVKNKNTGYCAKLRDYNDLTTGIIKIMNLSNEEFELVSKECRKVALEYTSDKAFAQRFLEVYNKYK